MTLHYDPNVPRVRDEIKRLEEYPNVLAINFMKEVETTRRLKRKLRQDL